jgi:hypothetical protein
MPPIGYQKEREMSIVETKLCFGPLLYSEGISKVETKLCFGPLLYSEGISKVETKLCFGPLFPKGKKVLL